MDDVSILDRYSREHYGLDSCFCNLAIETSNFCNRGCGFCPVGHDRKPVRRMEESLYVKILHELMAFSYRGDICLQWYNEPLADRRLPMWTALARAACPNSFIYCASNGDFLTQPLFESLVAAGMDLIRVSQYDGAVNDNVQAVLDAGKWLDHLHVSVKGADVLTNTRGGTVNLRVVQPLALRCTRPDEQILIDAHGRVPLCCNDYHVSYCPGSAYEKTVLELWNDPMMVEARGWLRQGDRTRIEVCRGCNEPDVPYEKLLPKGTR